jgi:hypothetical protein
VQQQHGTDGAGVISQLLFSLCAIATTMDARYRKEVRTAILSVSTKPVSHSYLQHQLIQLFSHGTVRVRLITKWRTLQIWSNGRS